MLRRGCMPKPGSFGEKGHRNRPGWGSGGGGVCLFREVLEKKGIETGRSGNAEAGGVCLNLEVLVKKGIDFADGVHDTMFRRILVRITL